MSDIMLAWIQFAIDVEKAGYEFYKDCVEAFEDQRAKELFKWLVDEEIKHEKGLQALLDKKSGGDAAKVKAAVAEFNKLSVESPLFTQEDRDKMFDKQTMMMERFNMAANMERKGIDLYLDLEDQNEDPDLKAFFHDLATQELGHKKRIVSVSMSLLGMEPEDEKEQTKEEIEAELRSQKTVFKELEIYAEKGEFKPRDLTANKGETIILKIISKDTPAGFRCINFQINEYIPAGQSVTVKFLADTAGKFEFFSNVPVAGGNEKMRGNIIVEGENEHDDDL